MPMKKVCSFCGRGENEVKLLISGLNGQICENCVEQAYQIRVEFFLELQNLLGLNLDI